jgi:SAM-dependent methyltransferase
MLLDNYKETFDTWNKLAKLYEDKFMHLDLYNESYDFFCTELVKEKPEILELGCGPGNITKYLLTKRPDFRLLATDIAPNMVELAKVNNPRAQVAVLDSRAIDQLTTKFDAIVCGFCIPYLSPADCEKLIQDSARILEPNGLMYISFVEGLPEQSGFQTGSSGDRTYFYFHTLEALKASLTRNNFETLKLFKVAYQKTEHSSDFHSILIAKHQ